MSDQHHDPWALLGLPRTFQTDAAQVRRAYLARAAQVHPDVSGLDPDEAAAQTAALNLAKATLDDPERRASELLRLLGGPAKEDDRSLPPGFLAEMMDAREQMDAEPDPARWHAWAQARRAAHEAHAARLFDEILPLTPTDPRRTPLLKALRTELNAWRYVERMLEQITPPGA